MKSIIRKPTIKDVAEKSNVSIATVSKILNDLDGFSEETRIKVLSVVEEIGYKRNEIARNLKVKESRTIGVLFPRVDTLFYVEILNGIEDFAHDNGYSVIICNAGYSGARTSEYIKVFSERQVDGIIACSLPPEEALDLEIVNSSIPSILVSTISPRYPIPYVKIDDYQAAYSATEYLIKKGHEKIAMLGGDRYDQIAGIPRANGFIQALKDNNIVVKDNLIKLNGFSFKEGVISMEQLLCEKDKFTAIFAASDDIAVGALSVAHRKWIRVPDDISIIGYDNTKIAEMSYPALTTVAQPFYDMGKRAVEMLLKKINFDEIIENAILPFEIIERETVKRIG